MRIRVQQRMLMSWLWHLPLNPDGFVWQTGRTSNRNEGVIRIEQEYFQVEPQMSFSLITNFLQHISRFLTGQITVRHTGKSEWAQDIQMLPLVPDMYPFRWELQNCW